MSGGDIADMGTALDEILALPARALAREDQPRAVPRADSAAGRQARTGDGHAVDLAGGRAHVGACARRSGAGRDLLPGVSGPRTENLAALALKAFRAATGWDAPPLRLSILKRIPVAAGFGGGSADAAAALRLARHVSGLGEDQLLRELGVALGADVPAQVVPGRWLAGGAGELLEALPDPNPASFGLLVLPAAAGLSTAEVYAEADRLGLVRSAEALRQRRFALRRALELSAAVPAASELLENDLQRAAISLCPEIAVALEQAREAGADIALLSGSGPTVVGLFPHANGLGRANGPLRALRPIGDRPACPCRSAPRR